MGGRAVYVERLGEARVVHLDNDANLVNEPFLTAVHAAFDEIDADASGLPVVTTGTGKFFSNGFDLDYLGALRGDDLADFVRRACELLARVLTLGAPTVAAINGHAFGIGALLALAHDQRVMRADRGWFCLPEVDLGLQFHPFMQALITARLSPDAAAETVLTGRRYDGVGAVAAGIANEAVAEDQLVAAACARTAGWSGKRPDVLATLKRRLYGAVTAELGSPL
jgi:enoyl-CoA hydratase/carnithine racemase